MLQQNQLPFNLKTLIDDELETFKQVREIKEIAHIPPTTDIPIEKTKQQWLKIPNVICVFVDMKGSTKLSATSHDKSTAGVYQLFTGTAIRMFHEFNAPYIDVKGDGVFALFNQDQPYTALAAAISFKTFAHKVFVPKIKQRTDIDVGSHLGIDQKTVLVRKLGLKSYNGRTDRQNEVWAGKPVNMAAKLSGRSAHNELLVSDRYFKNIKNNAEYRCGCKSLIFFREEFYWEEKELDHFFSSSPFDFDKAYSLKDNWCSTHGKASCEHFLSLDKRKSIMQTSILTRDW